MSNLLARWRCSSNAVWTVYGLVVSTAMWVIDWIHRHTTDAWVEFASRLCAVMSCTCLHQRFLCSTVTGKNTDGRTAVGWQVLEIATGQSNTDSVTHSSFKHCIVATGTGKFASVTWTAFDIADGCTFRNLLQSGDISWTKADIFTKCNHLSDIHAFSRCNVTCGSIFELQFGQRTCVNWAVDHFCHLCHFTILAW
jgi:hypothetical protein